MGRALGTQARHTGLRLGMLSLPSRLRACIGMLAATGWLPRLLLALGLLVRLAVWWDSRGYEPYGDEQYYYRAAVTFAQTGVYRDPPTPAWLPVQRVPLLSLLAGALFRLTGVDLGPVNLVQIGLSLATCWFVWRWASALWGRSAGLWGLTLAVFYPTLITHPASFFYTETLYTFLAGLALYLLGRIDVTGRPATATAEPARAGIAAGLPSIGPLAGGWRLITGHCTGLALLGGIIIGLAALTRSAGLVLLGIALLWLLLTGRQGGRRAGLVALLLVLGFTLTVAPWTLRNYRTYGGFLLLDTIGAYNLWRENALPGENPVAVLAGLANPVEQQRVAMEHALHNLRTHPDRFVAKLPAAILYLWHLELDSYARGAGYVEDLTNRDESFAWALAADAAHLTVSVLALLGLALAPWRHRRTPAQTRLQLLLLLWIAANLLSCIVIHTESRYRIPYQPQLIVFAALPLVAWSELRARARAAPWRALLAAVLLLLFLAGAWSPRLLPVLHMQAWVMTGHLLSRWHTPTALAAYERATAAFPASDRPFTALGDARRRANDLPGSIAAYTTALTILPDNNLAAAIPLSHLHWQAGRRDEAQRIVRATGIADTTLLTWGWRQYTPPPAAALDLGSGLEVGYLLNFHPPERNEQADFRWTDGHGLVRLTAPPDGAARLSLRLNGTRLSGGPPAAWVEVLVNGRPLDAFAADGSWQTRTLDLRPLNLGPGTPLLVEIRSETFVPARLVPGTRDTRRLGVAVDAIAVERP